jgi:Uma2 family endonuclease
MAVSLTDYVLKDVFKPGFVVRIQTGFITGLDTNPGPDLAVVVGTPRDLVQTPRQAVLIVEVSDTSLAMDTGAKVHIYAAAGVPEYWVIDVNAPRLLVYRDPIADPAAPRGFRYATTQTLTTADAVSPTAMPSATIRVADMLP